MGRLKVIRIVSIYNVFFSAEFFASLLSSFEFFIADGHISVAERQTVLCFPNCIVLRRTCYLTEGRDRCVPINRSIHTNYENVRSK